MAPKHLRAREEALAPRATVFALFPVQRDLVPLAVVLARERFAAPERADELFADLGSVRAHVHLPRVCARQHARARRVQARVLRAPPLLGALCIRGCAALGRRRRGRDGDGGCVCDEEGQAGVGYERGRV